MPRDHRLQTVPYRPNPARATVIDCRPGHQGPYLQGDGHDNFVCGKCGEVLVQGMVVAFLTLYLCCPQCGTYNLHHGGQDPSKG